MGPRTPWRSPNSEKSLRGEFLGLAPSLTQISRKSVTPNATCMVHFLVQPLLKHYVQGGGDKSPGHLDDVICTRPLSRIEREKGGGEETMNRETARQKYPITP